MGKDFLKERTLAWNLFISKDWYFWNSEIEIVLGSGFFSGLGRFANGLLDINLFQYSIQQITRALKISQLSINRLYLINLMIQQQILTIISFFYNLLFFDYLLYSYYCYPPMYFEDNANVKQEEPTKQIYIYQNSSNLKHPISFKIRNQHTIFKEIAKLLKYRKLRLFNSEGSEYFEDDIRFIKNKATVYASKGEQFDPHNCFGEYQLEKKLGEGGFGEVFLAKHKHTKEKCAIKIIKISASTDIDSIFVEAEILKSLKHQNIVKVENCLTLKNMQVAIIMEYLEGGELLRYVQKQGKLDEEQCKIFLKQIVKGMVYCHESNLIHRDLKLQNILLVNSKEKKIKIIDFGIAGVLNKLKDQDLDSGSLAYMAPECFSITPQTKFDGRIDVWAIGVILYGMLVGELPFKGSANYQVKENIRKGNYKIPNQIRRLISKQCLSVLFRCLDINPKTRITIGQLSNHQWFSKEAKELHKEITFEAVEEKKEEHEADRMIEIVPEKRREVGSTSINNLKNTPNNNPLNKSVFGQKSPSKSISKLQKQKENQRTKRKL